MKRRKRNPRKKGKRERRRKKRKIDFSLSANPNMTLFRRFYKSQDLLKDYDSFFASLEEPLPITFRINASLYPEVVNSLRIKILSYFSDKIRQANINKNDFLIEMNNRRLRHFEERVRNNEETNELSPEELRDHQEFIRKIKEKNVFISTLPPKILKPPRILPWYPRQLAFQVDCSKQMFSKHPSLQEFRQWLIVQTERGLISRQESVSMIPPLLFPYHRDSQILDSCAAPGSKTAQLLEFLSFEQQQSESSSTDLPLGVVIANDLNIQRCQTLVHQQLRLKELVRNLIVTNHDATMFPQPVNLRKDYEQTLDAKEKEEHLLRFDCVLCDVVCSGDGTMRKQPDVWLKWRPTLGWEYHTVQLKIALNGAEMLKPGGYLVYSTCSMNPIEDEAVVAELLRRRPDLEIVDVRGPPNTLSTGHPPEILLRPGLNSLEGLNFWKVLDDKGEDIGEFVKNSGKYGDYLVPSMFPPSVDDVKRMNLKRCIRVLPHQNDSGGFFITLLRKKTTEGTETSQVKSPISPLLRMEPSECCVRDTNVPRWRYTQVYPPLPQFHVDRLSQEFGFPKSVGSGFFSHIDLESRKRIDRGKHFRISRKQQDLNLQEEKKSSKRNSEPWDDNQIGKHIHFGNPMVKRIVEINHICRRLSIVTAGLKAVEVIRKKRKKRNTIQNLDEDDDDEEEEKKDENVQYRLTQTGAVVLYRRINNQYKIFDVKRQTFVVLLLNDKIHRDTLVDKIGDKQDLANLQSLFTLHKYGSFVVKTDDDVVLLMFAGTHILLRSVSKGMLDRIKMRLNVKI